MKVWTQEEFNEQYEDALEPIYCPYCMHRGYKQLLGPRILQPNEPRPADYDSFVECLKCCAIIPIYELPKEETVTDAVETIENPFEGGKFQLESIPKRSSPAGKRAIAKRSRKKIKLDEDPEINDLLRIYGDRVNVLK